MRILESLRPEVVFEEIRPGDFTSLDTLETRAVRRYAKKYAVREVPVDSYVTSETLRGDLDAMLEYVESIFEYHALVEEMARKKHEGGFLYLNSPTFEALSNRSCEIRDWAVGISGDDDLERALSTWKDLMASREETMLDNIYGYCQRNAFTNGVFLVGAGHFSSTVKSIEGRSKAEPNVVTWNLWNRS